MSRWVGTALALLTIPPPAIGAVYTWTGGGASTHWSDAANWGGSGPVNGETGIELIFSPLAGPYTSHNDLVELHVVAVEVTSQLGTGTYAFTGNAVAFDGEMAMASPGTGNPNLVWQIPLLLAGDAAITTSGRQTRVEAPIDLGASTLTLEAIGDVVLAGVISGSGNLVKSGSAALTITAANTYGGSTTGNAGALYIADGAAFGAAAAGTTFNGGFLGFVGGPPLVTSEPFTFNGGGIVAYGTPTLAGPVTLNATVTMQPFEPLSVLTLAGNIIGAGGITKTGPGTLAVTAAVAGYQGPTAVNAGTLQLDTVANSTAVTVGNGGRLIGTGGTAGPIAIASGGTLAPGSSPGRLSGGTLAMAAGGVLAAELDGPDPITGYDQVAVAGPVTLDGATLALVLGYEPPDGQHFTLIAQLAGAAVSGTFAGLPEGAAFQAGNTTFGITYRGGSGQDVVLLAGPPPTHTATPISPDPTATRTPAAATPSHTAAAVLTATETPSLARPSSTPPVATPTVPASPSPTRVASATAVSTSATATRTAEPATGTPSGTATAMPLATPTGTAVRPSCTGDCDDSGAVTINELVLGVNIALGLAPLDACPAMAPDGDRVTVAQLVQAVGNALNGCPPPPRGPG